MFRVVLRCRQLARERFAKLRSDVLVKMELLDNKHGMNLALFYCFRPQYLLKVLFYKALRYVIPFYDIGLCEIYIKWIIREPILMRILESSSLKCRHVKSRSLKKNINVMRNKKFRNWVLSYVILGWKNNNISLFFTAHTVQDLVFQLQKLLEAMTTYHNECEGELTKATIFPIEVDLCPGGAMSRSRDYDDE